MGPAAATKKELRHAHGVTVPHATPHADGHGRPAGPDHPGTCDWVRPMAGPLPTRTRAGYALGGVATGSFGTVPGLMLLPYLTERLAVPAALAGIIVFAPKAWDVVLNPIAGRISDRHAADEPRPAVRSS